MRSTSRQIKEHTYAHSGQTIEDLLWWSKGATAEAAAVAFSSSSGTLQLSSRVSQAGNGDHGQWGPLVKIASTEGRDRFRE